MDKIVCFVFRVVLPPCLTPSHPHSLPPSLSPSLLPSLPPSVLLPRSLAPSLHTSTTLHFSHASHTSS